MGAPFSLEEAVSEVEGGLPRLEGAARELEEGVSEVEGGHAAQHARPLWP